MIDSVYVSLVWESSFFHTFLYAPPLSVNAPRCLRLSRAYSLLGPGSPCRVRLSCWASTLLCSLVEECGMREMKRRRGRGSRRIQRGRSYFALFVPPHWAACLSAPLVCMQHCTGCPLFAPISPSLPVQTLSPSFLLLISLTSFHSLFAFFQSHFPTCPSHQLFISLKYFRPLILTILPSSLPLSLSLSVSHAAGTGWVCLPDCPPGIAAGTQNESAPLCRPAGWG